MTTAPSIHSGTTPPAAQENGGTGRVTRTGPAAPRVENLRRSLHRWSAERERPEDDEAVITAVLATVTHRSFRERPEDDEVVLTYTSEPACRHKR